MSDSFADLWASSSPSKSTPERQPIKIGTAVPPRRRQYDAFSILSASQPSSKPLANNQLSDQQGPRPQPVSSRGDAFSDLFTPSLDGSAASRNPDQASLSMAERAVLARKAKIAQDNAASTPIGPAHPSLLWDGLDALARPATSSPRLPASVRGDARTRDSFDFGFDGVDTAKVAPSTTSPPRNTGIENDDWGLSEFGPPPPSGSQSAPAPAKPASESRSTTLWDLKEFGSSAQRPQPPQLPARSRTGTPDDFDFGDREDGLLGGDDSDVEDTFSVRNSHFKDPGDDILGDLGKPRSRSHSPSPNPTTLTPGVVGPSRTSASPPPHITGQLVEMGFSPVDARAALMNTAVENSFDVQTATELLLSQASQSGSARPSPHPTEHENRRNGDRDTDRNRAGRPPPPTRADLHTRPPSTSQPQPQPQLDLTAEKLLSQASDIGRGVFSKANALWKGGKERAVKMYEEMATTNSTSVGSALDARPRWMRDPDQASGGRQRPNRSVGRSAVQVEFEDDEDGNQKMGRAERQRPPARRPPQSQVPQPEHDREVDLFGADSPTTTYQSPFQPPRTFTTTIALRALSASSYHKSAGTDSYKRGDFSVALTSYMRALSALPPGHVLRVPVLTNVALVRSKVGELKEAVKACEEAVVIVRRFVGGAGGEGEAGMSFTVTESDFDEKTAVEVGSGKVSISVQGDGDATSNGNLPASIDLAEGLSKAFRRRAEALEGLEKWETARSTWEVLASAKWAGAGVRGEAMKGVGRCRRMIDGGLAAATGPPSQSIPPKPKAIPPPHVRPKSERPEFASPPPSAALAAFRSNQDTQKTEDAARLECKDAVDARLTAWKAGREGNIRALLTSLDDTVLWPSLGWRKVGMAEVVSKGQVKGAYVRAIAKVHPDKLNAGNTTVEQRMIASGVFGELNEAWNAFQQQ